MLGVLPLPGHGHRQVTPMRLMPVYGRRSRMPILAEPGYSAHDVELGVEIDVEIDAPPPPFPPGSRLLRHALAEGAKDANLHDVYLHVQARRL